MEKSFEKFKFLRKNQIAYDLKNNPNFNIDPLGEEDWNEDEDRQKIKDSLFTKTIGMETAVYVKNSKGYIYFGYSLYDRMGVEFEISPSLKLGIRKYIPINKIGTVEKINDFTLSSMERVISDERFLKYGTYKDLLMKLIDE